MCSTLEIDSVTMTFGHRRILSDIYLKCQTGDIIGLLGRNGCGKSTLLKILFGSLSCDNKFIRIDGKVYDNPYLSPGIISYLPQDSFLLSHLNVRQVAKLYLKQQSEKFLDDELLKKLAVNKIESLSGGELRYLEIKLLLHLPSKFILMDEPFNGVSPLMVDYLKEMIRTHSATKGIILTDHDYMNVLNVATKQYLLHDGTVKQVNTRSDLVKWQYLPAGNFEDE